MATADIEVPVEPRAEWRQIFTDAYRFERDFFYDPNMHGADWPGLRARYGKLLEDAVTRWDLNFVLGEFIGELNASHTYRGGGDEEKAPQRSVGMLGSTGSSRTAPIASSGSCAAVRGIRRALPA
jgi:tricorn protease